MLRRDGKMTSLWISSRAIDPAGNPSGWVGEDHFNYDAMGNRLSG
ncbi:MAG TPA: hypothetical protein VGW57_02375 [Chthoniobacterales bacterium]|nr:hypothetical protein [Chthoniobacterales bacterium]